MQVREATESDAEAIRDVAEQSLQASYSLSPATIRGAITEWYDDEAMAAKLDDDDHLFLVAEDEGEVVGFSDSTIIDAEGDVLWLHVDPAHRGRGLGDELFEITADRLRERGAETIRGMVLADNEEGNAFYEAHGLQQAGEREVDIDGDGYVENVYVTQQPAELDAVTDEDGTQLYVDRTDATRGAEDVLYTVYSDADGETKWGYLCGNCESLVTSMDSMGRMECENCGNVSKPTRWDAAYM